MKREATAAPSTEDQYQAWVKDKLGVDFSSRDISSLYALNVSAALTTIQETRFWRELPRCLAELEVAYRNKHGAELFPGKQELNLDKKPYTSVVEKTFRRNVLWNSKWPAAPEHGWVTDETMYTALDDLLRTTIVCTFLDGPALISEALKNACESETMPCELRVVNRDEGHYAHHLYVKFPVNIVARSGAVKAHQLKVEFQVTTQAQQLLRQLTHPYYREERVRPRGKKEPWQWQYKTNKFRARYVSHALHLLEAMILELRDNRENDD